MIYKITVKRYFKLFCLLVVFAACSRKTFETLFPQITDEESQEVKNICNNLKLPPSFMKTDDRYSVKRNSALRYMQYSSPDSYDEVEKYFVSLLKQSGWRYQKEVGNGTLHFKKGKYSISIESHGFSFESNKTYLIDCSIGIS